MIDYGYGIKLDTLERAAHIRAWRNDRAIYDYCRQVGLITENDQAKWMQGGDNKHMFSLIGEAMIPMSANMAETVIGVGGLTAVHPVHRSAEISLYVAKEYHGAVVRGTTHAIIQTIAAYAFECLGLNRIFGDTFETNFPELVNLQDVGFVKEGTLRESYYKNGEYINSVIQSLLRSDYERIKDGWRGNSV